MPPSFALVQRELLRTLRKGRAFFFLACIVLITAWVLIEGWPGEYTPASMLGWQSQNVLGSLVIAIYIAGLVLMPAYGATSLVVEREQHTWDLLALTLIRPAGVVLGKLLNTLGVYALLVIAVLPVVAAVYFLVGVDWLLILILCPIVAVTAFWAASVGVMCSAWFRSTVPSVLASYVCVAFVLGAYLIPLAIVDEFFRVPQFYGFFESWGPVLSSPMALVFAVEDEFSMLHFAAAVATQLGYGFIALFIAWLAIRRSREGTLPGEPRDSLVRRFMRALFGFSGVRRPIYRPLRDAANPMLVKEMRWGWQGRRKLRMLVFGGLFAAQALLAISLWAALSNVVPTERAVIVGVYWAVFVAGIIAVVTPALLANTLTKEYERENIDALRMTLMKSGTIVWGKVWSGIAAAIPMLTAILLGGILVGILAEDLVWPWKFVTVVFVSSIATIFLVLVLSIYASMLTKRTPAAIILSYTCAWMVLFGFCWLGWYSNGSMSPDAFDAAMAFTSPAMGCGFHLLSLGPFDSEFYDDSTNFFSAFWISNVLFHVAFAIVLLLICIRAFRMSRMQDR